jgi:hypothetical protein
MAHSPERNRKLLRALRDTSGVHVSGGIFAGCDVDAFRCRMLPEEMSFPDRQFRGCADESSYAP